MFSNDGVDQENHLISCMEENVVFGNNRISLVLIILLLFIIIQKIKLNLCCEDGFI